VFSLAYTELDKQRSGNNNGMFQLDSVSQEDEVHGQCCHWGEIKHFKSVYSLAVCCFLGGLSATMFNNA